MLRFSGSKLREARGDRPYEEIALAARCSAQAVRNWENNRHEPGCSQLARIAEHLGLPMEAFFQQEEAA